MAKTLQDWVSSDVAKVKDRTAKWLSQHYFFRDPARGMYVDSSRFFSPADGILMYQKVAEPDEPILDIKGISYTLRDAMRDPGFSETCAVIGIFMTFYDVHVQRTPYSGYLSYEELETIDTYNYPMIDFEKALIEQLDMPLGECTFIHNNQRMLNTIYAPTLGLDYYVLQIADYDVDCITPFALDQSVARRQGERFSAIRFGSQVELIVPLDKRYRYDFIYEDGMHVEAAIDPLIEIEAISSE